MKPTFFATPAAFRKWLERHHRDRAELLVGFHRKGSGLASITWPESVDQALCFGWIDGVRRGLDENSYTIRFTPRKPKSRWSAVNIKRARELQELGLMTAAGLAEFAKADANQANYAYEQRREGLPAELEAEFRKHAQAWKFFTAQPPGYQRTLAFWVSSAKREETRRSRLQKLIETSARGERMR
ncbi:MAG TPA: YdeI/OmpD-associated family protein [Thermoanaerobaculia bacterium]|nr:YdeI/OmpD-associated family protein [Thermoanaerobaculia bacterium]